MDIQNHYNSIIDLSKKTEFKDFNYENICNTKKTIVTLKNDYVTVIKSNYQKFDVLFWAPINNSKHCNTSLIRLSK